MQRLFSPTSKLAFALRPAIPALTIGTLLAAGTGVMTLSALWCVIQLIAGHHSFWLAGALIFWILSALLSGSASWINHNAEAQFSGRLKRDVAAHLVRLPPSTLAKYKGEKLKRLMVDDIASLHHMIAHLPSELATFIIVPAITIGLLILSAGPVSLLALIPGLVAALFYLVVVPRLAAKQGEARVNVMGNITAAVDDYSRGASVFRIYGDQTGAIADYQKATKHFIEEIIERVSKVSTSVAVATSLLQAVCTFAIVYAIGYEWPPEKLAAALFFSLAIVTPALKLGHGLDYLATGRAAAQRLTDFLGQSRVPVGSGNIELNTPMPLTLTDVVPSLSTNSKTVPINYQFRSGKVTAVTGISGVGKSTLLRLLAGMEPLNAGDIRLAGIALNEMGEASINRAIMLLPQSAGLLATSIADNLALSAPDATDEDYLVALHCAQLDKPLNTHASTLSGGEIQRVNLARVFLSPARVILLDEPTSALDIETAFNVFTALRHHAKTNHKTIVMVTHDLTLSELADDKLTLKHHHIEGEGQ
ncbi:ATP-binding cassette domain-containing protein [Shewanella baltica]|uniref:ATP-binding cassette domain-containing protein n=1 Tax=Shewanella baltica TaxID=62322 RepID=UPI003D01994D